MAAANVIRPQNRLLRSLRSLFNSAYHRQRGDRKAIIRAKGPAVFLVSGKRGAIPVHLDPILKRVGIVSSGWCDLIEQFDRLFKRAVGSPKALAEEAEARGQKYLQGLRTTAFISG